MTQRACDIGTLQSGGCSLTNRARSHTHVPPLASPPPGKPEHSIGPCALSQTTDIPHPATARLPSPFATSCNLFVTHRVLSVICTRSASGGIAVRLFA